MRMGKNPLDGKLYVYLPKRYIAGLFVSGTIRIGTLGEYRVPDGKAGGKSDTEEATKTWFPPMEQWTPDLNHPFCKSLNMTEREVNNATFHFAPGLGFAFQSDAYVLCTSRELSKRVARKMKSLFGANGCYRILDVDGFFSAISSTPPLKGLQSAGRPVQYKDTDKTDRSDWPNLWADPFLKTNQYEWQKEVRALWRPKDYKEPISGVVLHVAGLGNFVEVVDIDKLLTS